MKNITITLDAETASWIRVLAAEKNVSVSRLVGEILSEKMGHRLAYEQAMRSFLSRPPFDLKGEAEPYPTRDEIHDRSRFR
jgi:hypothetical protein